MKNDFPGQGNLLRRYVHAGLDESVRMNRTAPGIQETFSVESGLTWSDRTAPHSPDTPSPSRIKRRAHAARPDPGTAALLRGGSSARGTATATTGPLEPVGNLHFSCSSRSISPSLLDPHALRFSRKHKRKRKPGAPYFDV